MSASSVLPAVALELWRFSAQEAMQVHVPPDGCRDLIVVAPRGRAPAALASALAGTSETHAFAPGDRAVGVRLRPGAQMDERALLAAVDAAVRLDARVAEALDCLREAPPLLDALASSGHG